MGGIEFTVKLIDLERIYVTCERLRLHRDQVT